MCWSGLLDGLAYGKYEKWSHFQHKSKPSNGGEIKTNKVQFEFRLFNSQSQNYANASSRQHGRAFERYERISPQFVVGVIGVLH